MKRLSLEDLRCVSSSMVYAKRLAHIRGCEEEAARLIRSGSCHWWRVRNISVPMRSHSSAPGQRSAAASRVSAV